MGSDNLEKLHKWDSWRKIAKLSKIVIFPRQGYKNRFLKCKAYKMLKKDIDILVELVGGSEGIAKKIVFGALKNKIQVVTANKSLLAKYGDTGSINALTAALKKSESKIMDLREVIVQAIGENGSDDQIITLLELYEISKINHQKNSQLLSNVVSDIAFDNDEGIAYISTNK